MQSINLSLGEFVVQKLRSGEKLRDKKKAKTTGKANKVILCCRCFNAGITGKFTRAARGRLCAAECIMRVYMLQGQETRPRFIAVNTGNGV